MAQSGRPAGRQKPRRYCDVWQIQAAYRWGMLKNFVFLGQIFIELKDRRDIAAAE